MARTGSTALGIALRGRGEQGVHRVVPGGEGAPRLIGMEPLEARSPQTQPRAVAEVLAHRLPPDRNGKPVLGLAVPRDRRDLKAASRLGIEDASAEQELERHLPAFERLEVL